MKEPRGTFLFITYSAARKLGLFPSHEKCERHPGIWPRTILSKMDYGLFSGKARGGGGPPGEKAPEWRLGGVAFIFNRLLTFSQSANQSPHINGIASLFTLKVRPRPI